MDDLDALKLTLSGSELMIAMDETEPLAEVAVSERGELFFQAECHNTLRVNLAGREEVNLQIIFRN